MDRPVRGPDPPDEVPAIPAYGMLVGVGSPAKVVQGQSSLPVPAADRRAWRRVRTGLKLASYSWIFLVIPAIFVFALALFVALLASAFPWVGFVVMAVVVLHYVGCVLFLLIGMGMTCCVPLETGGRRLAQSAFFSMVTAAGLTVMAIVLGHADVFRPMGPRAGQLILLLTFLAPVAAAIVGMISWLLFLRAVGSYLGRSDLASLARFLAVAFSLWAGFVLASLGVAFAGVRADQALTAFATCGGVLGLGLLYCTHLVLLEALRQTVQTACMRAASDQ